MTNGEICERLIRLRDGTDSEWKREVLADAVNALADAEALREELENVKALLRGYMGEVEYNRKRAEALREALREIRRLLDEPYAGNVVPVAIKMIDAALSEREPPDQPKEDWEHFFPPEGSEGDPALRRVKDEAAGSAGREPAETRNLPKMTNGTNEEAT